ncbi:MAG: VCBS repeat-containing protein, partial [Planctomycetaceae bacterium]|nr:VCBS repeat-containing protein [Planctomycetaceae bacterium]
TGAELLSITPYPGFTGGVRVATGDINGDGTPDLITGAGPGGGPHVQVFDGASGAVVLSFFAFGPGFSGGVNVASADVNQDGKADLIVSAGPGGGPHVRVLSGEDLTELFSIFPYSLTFSGGVQVAAGDLTGDGVPDLITGAGPGGGPHVRVFDGTTMQVSLTPTDIGGPLGSFFAYGASFSGGVFVASGDTNADGQDDLITGAGPGGGPHVQVFNGSDGTVLHQFFPYDVTFGGGVRVASTFVNDDSAADILTAAGPTGGPHVRAFDGLTGTSLTITFPSFPYPATFDGGVFVAGNAPLGQIDNTGSSLQLTGTFASTNAQYVTQPPTPQLGTATENLLERWSRPLSSLSAPSNPQTQIANQPASLLGEAFAANVGRFVVSIPSRGKELGFRLQGDESDHLLAESLSPNQHHSPTLDVLDRLFADEKLLDTLLS